jgi:hypothetical protein
MKKYFFLKKIKIFFVRGRHIQVKMGVMNAHIQVKMGVLNAHSGRPEWAFRTPILT